MQIPFDSKPLLLERDVDAATCTTMYGVSPKQTTIGIVTGHCCRDFFGETRLVLHVPSSSRAETRNYFLLSLSSLLQDWHMTGSDNQLETMTACCRQAGGVEGIVNGMDTTDWSPNVDKFLDVKYDADTVDEGKVLAKEALQAELGLPVSSPPQPVLCMSCQMDRWTS